MEIKLGNGCVLITVTERDGQLGLLLNQTCEPHDIGSNAPHEDEPNYLPNDADVIVWTPTIETALILKEQVDRLCQMLL